MVETDRVHDLPGGVNFRDFGGYETADGAHVRRRLLFRCGHMANMTPEGRAGFRQLGIGVVCDLRRVDEREEEPTPFPAHDPRQVHIPIDPGSAVRLRESFAELGPREQGFGLRERIDFMVGINRELAVDHVDDYRAVFDALLAADDNGFLIHCTAGKDRTGFGVAIIQMALGVSRDTVIEDYMLTNDLVDVEGVVLPRMRELYAREEVDVDEAMALSGVREEYIHAALETMEAAFGSFERYLSGALGISTAERDRLKERYLE
jgi:protein-tyrosine phosphatase